MAMSSRTVWAMGLGVLGLSALVAQSRGQSDAAVRRTSNTAAAAESTVKIGSIDMEKAFKEYKKVEFTSKQIKAEITSKQNALMKVMNEGKALAKELEGLKPGTPDARAKESQLNKIKAELEAERESAQADFARKEAEALSNLYKEVQAMAGEVAKYHKLTAVIKVSNEPITSSDPNSVMAAMSRTVIYADPTVDITDMVVLNLNKRYDATMNAKPRSATPATTPAPAATPRGN